MCVNAWDSEWLCERVRICVWLSVKVCAYITIIIMSSTYITYAFARPRHAGSNGGDVREFFDLDPERPWDNTGLRGHHTSGSLVHGLPMRVFLSSWDHT